MFFVRHMATRSMADAARTQDAAFNTRHAGHGHSAAENVACDHDLALCYIYEASPVNGDRVEIIATGETATVERVFTRPGHRGFGIRTASNVQMWVPEDGVRALVA